MALTGWNDEWTDKDVYESFTRNLLTLRTLRGFTQTQLADMLGYTRISISNIERGKQGATLPTIVRLAWALDTTPTELLARNIVVHKKTTTKKKRK